MAFSLIHENAHWVILMVNWTKTAIRLLLEGAGLKHVSHMTEQEANAVCQAKMHIGDKCGIGGLKEKLGKMTDSVPLHRVCGPCPTSTKEKDTVPFCKAWDDAHGLKQGEG